MSTWRAAVLYVFMVMAVTCLSSQTPQWDWAIGAGGSSHDQAHGIAVDAAGNQYVTGWFSGNISIGEYALTNNGLMDVFVAKLDPMGTCLWAVSAGGPSLDKGLEVALDDSGNILVTGVYYGTSSFGATTFTSSGPSDMFVAKLDNAGNWLWARSAGGYYSYEDIITEQSNGIATDTGGNVLISGVFCGQASFGPLSLTSYYSHEFQNFNQDMFVAKLDPDGNWLWAVGSLCTGWAEGRSLCADGNGNVCVVGHFGWQATFGDTTLASVNNGYDIFVSKLSPEGNWLWSVAANGIGQDLGADIAVGPGNTLYITGSFKHPLTFGATTLELQDVYRQLVAKLDSAGNWLWAVPLGGLGTQNDDAFVAVDEAGNAYLTGVFKDSAPFGASTLTSAGSYDAYAAKMDPTGNIQWALRAGGAGNDYGKGIGLDEIGKVRIAGFFFGSSSFGATTLPGNSDYGSDIFVASVGGGVPVYDAEAPGADGSMLCPVWPNPLRADGLLHIAAKVAERDIATISIYNIRGQMLSCRKLSPGYQQLALSMASHPTGVYFCRMQTTSRDIVRRFVIVR